jgi:hypothetical protein
MSIDSRTRRRRDRRDIGCDEVFDSMLPDAVERNGELAARGIRYKELPPLGLEVETLEGEGREGEGREGEEREGKRREGKRRAATLREQDGKLVLEDGVEAAAAVASIGEGALSDLVQDWKTTMGLAMNAKVQMTRGAFDAWIGWEPVFRALLDGRPVHEAGAIVLRDRAGQPLDTSRSFALGDDRDEISHFLQEAGFLHIRSVFDESEMAAVSGDLDRALERAERDDGASWWAGDSQGAEHPVRVLWFHEQSEALRELLHDERLQWLAGLCGDGHDGRKMGAEGLIKPLDIQTGLSDLPWHKDCGQGGHSYMCCGLTVGISITGADRRSGALGVVPGSHRANVQTAGRDESLDLEPIKLETRTGDLTVHCSDTLHRAHRPTEKPRKVVYTGFRLPLLPGDVAPEVSKQDERAARAQLTNVRDRIAGSGGNADA